MTVLTLNRSRKKAAEPPKVAADAQGQEEEEARYRPIDRMLLMRMLRLLAPYKRHYALGLVLGLIMTVLEMQGPRFVSKIINYGADYVGHALTPMPSERGAVWHVAGIVGVWALVLVTAITIQRFTILITTGAGERVQFGVRRRLFEHLQRLSMSYYDKTKLGRIISRCTSDISSMREVNVWGLYTIGSNLLMMIIAAGMLISTDIRLFLSVAWLAPIMFVANRVYLKKTASMWQNVRETWTRVSTNLAENISGMRVVTAFNRQAPNLETFNSLQNANTANNVTVARITGIYQPVLSMIGFTGKAIIVSYGGYLIVTGRIGQSKGLGAVVAAYMYWDWFMNPVLSFGIFYNTLLQAMAGAERVFNLLDTRPDVQDVPGATSLPRIVGHVSFENVTFGYNPDRPVLHDVCFEARPGQMIALVGATGGGKSSIISLIARFYQPQKGRVLVDGYDLRTVTGESLHRQMGLVLQVNYLFTGTVMENIRYSKPGATEQDVIRAAQEIGSHDAIMTLKESYQGEVGERGANMSLGQRQLICFTRAYLADPRIFMLDEATSAVDTATEQLVQQSLERLLAGRSTFIVAHRLSTIMRADKILVVDSGRIIESGTHRQLLAARGKYSQLYEQFVQHTE